MAEVQKSSPKKLPADEWVKAVKKVDVGGLKDDEKKLFEQVKAHKNIPTTQPKFANFCIHNLKVKNDKLINKIWGHLTAAVGPVAAKDSSEKTAKETKEGKKAKLNDKLKPKVANGTTKNEVKNSPKQVQPAKTVQPTKTAQVPETQQKFANFCINTLKVKDEKLINKIWGQLSAAVGPTTPKATPEKVPAKDNKEAKKAKTDEKVKPKGADVNMKNSKQESKKKVSFSKNQTSDEAAKPDQAAKNNKQVPKKQTPKKGKEAPKPKNELNKKKQAKVAEVDEDDDDDDDDDELGSDFDDLSFSDDEDDSDEAVLDETDSSDLPEMDDDDDSDDDDDDEDGDDDSDDE